jgi:hypothetical protein
MSFGKYQADVGEGHELAALVMLRCDLELHGVETQGLL